MMRVRLYNISIKCMLAILLAGLFASCKDDEEFYEARPSRMDALGIKFSTSEEGFELPSTRGVVNSVSGLNKVCVLSMKENGSGWEPVFNDASDNGLDVLVLNKVGNPVNGQIWEYAPKSKWQRDYNYKFRAYYPQTITAPTVKQMQLNGMTVNIPTQSVSKETCDNGGFTYRMGSTQLILKNYTSSQNPKNNNDLMVSDPIDRLNNTEVVALNMKHLLACVDFHIKSKQGYKIEITKFSVNGYVANGDCVIDDEPRWTVNYEDDDTDELQISWFKNQDKNDELSFYQRYVFRDKITDKELTFDEIQSRIRTRDDKVKYSYNILPGAPSIGTYSISGIQKDEIYKAFTGLLFIPQNINRGDKTFDIVYNLFVYNKYDVWNEFEGSGIRVENVLIKRNVFVEMEFYIDGDSEHPLRANIDLTAGGKVKQWEAGKRYTYTIGINLMDVNVEIENWNNHTINEEIR